MNTNCNLLALLSVALLAGACEHAPAQGSDAATANTVERTSEGIVRLPPSSRSYVEVANVSMESAATVLRLPARVAFRDGAVCELGSMFEGRVTHVDVKTGDQVAAGDRLLTVSCPDAAAIRTALATAQAAQREAEASDERETRMLASGVGTERDRLAAEIRLSETQAELDRARSAAAFLGNGSGPEVELRAPSAGRVLALSAAAGASVHVGGASLITIGDPDAMCLIADATERECALIVPDATAEVEVAALGAKFNARVESVGSVVNSSSRTAPLRLTLESPDARLRPGMFAYARVQALMPGPSLPVESVLIKSGKESVVYVAKDELTFERRTVTVGNSVEGRVRILSGLRPDERVVVRGALLIDGAADQLL